MSVLRASFMVCVGVLVLGAFWATGSQAQAPTPTPDDIASPAQLAQAVAEWEQSGHARTYDNGFGADTTCARCKSPLNWDPSSPAAEAALDCASCKRVPGEPRPMLSGSVPVPEDQWQHIGCEVCHKPAGDSYHMTPSFWNQETGAYQPVEDSGELCAHCHEGRHGFEVTEETEASPAHPGWTCLDCHGAHGDNVKCEDCHGPGELAKDAAHADHPDVHCSACHDAEGLALWRERDPTSPYYEEVITIRFAHTLTAWPSHNLQTGVTCEHCHHAGNLDTPPIAQNVACDNAACHPRGAVLFWCPFFGETLP